MTAIFSLLSPINKTRKMAKNKVTLVATFLGMLELARLKSVAIRQAQLFGEIRLYKKSLNPEADTDGTINITGE